MRKKGWRRRDVMMAALGAGLGVSSSAARAARRAQAPLSRACAEAIPAAELGLLPDPALDASAAFRRALGEAARRGRALLLPPGDVVLGEVDIETPVRLFGTPASRLVCRAGARYALRLRGAEAHLTGVRVDGAAQGAGGEQEDALGVLVFDGVEDVFLRDCEIAHASGHALSLEGCRGRVENVRVRRAAEAAIFALDCREMQIVGNDIAECGNGGVLVWQSQKRHDGALVAMNRIRRIRADGGGSGQNGNGVNVFRGGGVRVVDNDIAECAFSAVRDNSGDEVVIARNLCRRSGEVAIFVEFAFRKALVASNLVEGAAAGISITNMNEGGRLATVSGNIVRDVAPVRGNRGEEGFGIGAEADTAIIGNIVERAAKYALALGWGRYLRNVTATGNVVRESPVGAAVSVVKGAGTAVLAGNSFERVTLAVAGYDHARRVTGELLGRRRPPANIVLQANHKS